MTVYVDGGFVDGDDLLLDQVLLLLVLLACDPGKNNLAVVCGRRERGSVLRYSAGQRRQEGCQTRAATYRLRQLRRRLPVDFAYQESTLVEGSADPLVPRTFQEVQDTIQEGCRSCHYRRFARYLASRARAEEPLERQYSQLEYRRSAFRVFAATESSERRFAERLKSEFKSDRHPLGGLGKGA